MTACLRCGAHAVAGQEYCLECGARLPGPGAVGARQGLRSEWVIRATVALLVALAGATLAVAATNSRNNTADLVIATGGFATLPASTTLPPPSQGGAAGIADWPAGDDGWTIALATLPQTGGRQIAVTRARKAAKRGLSPVGILDSSQYASLHPGYWVVFTGVYGSEAEATSNIQPARRVARTATVRRIVP
ncbi:MAG: hypothetical protein M3364_05670 [Actinomycetota bacterium]|nr:hypothetical protein [Actinomycetota bacterium]